MARFHIVQLQHFWRNNLWSSLITYQSWLPGIKVLVCQETIWYMAENNKLISSLQCKFNIYWKRYTCVLCSVYILKFNLNMSYIQFYHMHHQLYITKWFFSSEMLIRYQLVMRYWFQKIIFLPLKRSSMYLILCYRVTVYISS